MSELKGKVAVVTGAKQGIGEGIALRLLKAGASVMLADLDRAAVRRTASAFGRKVSASMDAMAVDVSDRRSVEKLAQATLKKFGRLDIWVNNAGIYPYKPLLDMTDADWDRVLDVNLKGVFLGTQSAARRMTRGGRIIQISSIAARQAFASLTHYCASKGGVEAFSRAAAVELAPKGITVNCVAPGAIATPGVGALDEKTLASIVSMVPLRRMGQPADIAGAVAYLASDEASYVTGQTLVVDGGWTLT